MTFTNPVIPGFHPDPSVCRVGEEYYLAVSSFEYFPGIPVYHSRDLVHWEQIGHALTRDSQLPLQNVASSRGIYAPTLRYHDGTFFIVVTNVTSTGNFIVTAKSPEGPWSEPIPVDQGGIDPSLFFDDDGACYYTGTHRGGPEVQGIALFRINPFTGEKLSEPMIVWRGMGGKCPEAPHLYKIGGKYYLMIAEGGTEYGHSVTIARANRPEGPYEACPHNPILTHAGRLAQNSAIMGTGHGDLVQTPRGDWWMVFLAYRCTEKYFHHLGRETFLAPVTWENGWPVVNGGKPIEEVMDAPDLPPFAVSLPQPRDDFSAGIGLAWNTIRNPVRENYRTGPDGLTLTGTDVTLNDGGCPTFLGRRQEQFDATCSALVIPERMEPGACAGLSVFYDEKHHFDLFLRDGKIVLEKRVDDLRVVACEADWTGACELRVTAVRLRYTFQYGKPGEPPREAGTALTRHVSTEMAGMSFTGVYLGMFAQGGCSVRFPWFEYRNL